MRLGAFALLAIAAVVPGVELPPLPSRRVAEIGPPRPSFPREPTPEQVEEFNLRMAAWREQQDRIEQEKRAAAEAAREASVLETTKGRKAAEKRARRADRNRRLAGKP